MRKIFEMPMLFVLMLFLVFLLGACSEKTTQQVGDNSEIDKTANQDSGPLPQNEKMTDETADCTLLTEEEVDSICGDSVFVKDIPISGTEMCRIHFDKGGKSQWLYLTYTQTGSSTPQQLVDSCLSGGGFGGSKGETIGGGKGCLYLDGQNLKIAGKRYLITISNSNPELRVCTPEQMKKIGEKVISKLY